MPTKKFLAVALLLTTIGIAVFLSAVRDTDPGALPSNTAPQEPPPPPLTSFTPDPSRCPDVTPRTVPMNGPGWRILTDRTLCLVAEYPDGWVVQASTTGFSLAEPKQDKGEYFETAFPGELSAEVHVRFFAGTKSGTETMVNEEKTPMHAHVAAYRVRRDDGTLVTLNAHAPEDDVAKAAVVRAILRSIDLHGPEGTLSMSAYLP